MLRLEFPKGIADPQRIFSVAAAYIEALNSFDNTLIKSIDTAIKPVFVLEKVESGSLLIVIRQFIKNIPDDALRTGNWKICIGQYLVKGKYALLKLLGDCDGLPDEAKLNKMSDELHRLARDTQVLKLPAYSKIPPIEIAREAEKISEALAPLAKGEAIIYECDDGNAEIRAGFHVTSEEIDNLLVAQTLQNESTIILMIRKPDFLGESKWVFSFENRNITVAIDDNDWLAKYQAGDIDIRPGDALKVEMLETDYYAISGEVIKVDRSIQKVLGVIRPPAQGSLLDS